jgi:hypothetical protein
MLNVNISPILIAHQVNLFEVVEMIFSGSNVFQYEQLLSESHLDDSEVNLAKNYHY